MSGAIQLPTEWLHSRRRASAYQSLRRILWWSEMPEIAWLQTLLFLVVLGKHYWAVGTAVNPFNSRPTEHVCRGEGCGSRSGAGERYLWHQWQWGRLGRYQRDLQQKQQLLFDPKLAASMSRNKPISWQGVKELHIWISEGWKELMSKAITNKISMTLVGVTLGCSCAVQRSDLPKHFRDEEHWSSS